MPAGRGRRWARVLSVALPALLLSGAASAQTLERDLFVSVLNQADQPVLTLGPADFIVREDGRTREVLRARLASDKVDIALLVDTSQALGRHVTDVRMAIDAFAARMAGRAEISLIGLGDRPTILTTYTGDATELKKGLGRIFPVSGSGAYVLEGIQESLKGLEKRKPERSAIIVVWVGGVEFSSVSYEPLLSDLKGSGTALHVITVGTAVPPDAMTQEGRARETVFDRGTTESGGRRENVLSSMGLTSALTKMADELLGQYRVTYARPETLIPPEKIEVGVRPPGLTVRATPVPVRKGPAK